MITTVDFVSVNVSDQERAKRCYVEVLGLEELTDVPMGDPDGPRWIEVRPPGSATRVVLFAAADKAGAVTTAPKLEAWGSWWAEIQDSEGNTFGLGQRTGSASTNA